MFHKKMDKHFSSVPIIFSIADDFPIAGYDKQGKDNDETHDKICRIARQPNLKLNKEKCLFRCTSIPFFGKVFPSKV